MGKTWTEKGRGRKQCPKCEIYHGVRAGECPRCGHVYPKKSASIRPKRTPEELEAIARKKAERAQRKAEKKSERSDSREVILIPDGRCPVSLEATDADSVRAWCRAVIDANDKRHSRRYRLSDEALRYWMRRELSSEDYAVAVTHLGGVQ